MKKWARFILSFYVLFIMAAPCSIFDDCSEGIQVENNAHPEKNKDCSGCSPFCICSGTAGFTLEQSLIPEWPPFNNKPAHGEYTAFHYFEYYSSPFQPPRQG